MAREVVVPDASAIVTVLIDPGGSGFALAQRLAATRLAAPQLMPFEVDNVLRRRRNAGLLSPSEAALARGGLDRLPVELWPFTVLAERVRELGANLSSYDASYIALAERMRCPLLTRDTRLARAPGSTCPIEVF